MWMAEKGRQNETASFSAVARFLSDSSWFVIGTGCRTMFHGWFTELMITESHILSQSSMLAIWYSSTKKCLGMWPLYYNHEIVLPYFYVVIIWCYTGKLWILSFPELYSFVSRNFLRFPSRIFQWAIGGKIWERQHCLSRRKRFLYLVIKILPRERKVIEPKSKHF